MKVAPHVETLTTSREKKIVEEHCENPKAASNFRRRKPLKLCVVTCFIVLAMTIAAATAMVFLEIASVKNTNLKPANASAHQV